MKRISLFSLLVCLSTAASFAQQPDTLNLLPRPQSAKISAGRFTFAANFNIGVKGPESAKFIAAINRFYQQVGRRVNLNFSQEFISGADNNPSAKLFISYDKMTEP